MAVVSALAAIAAGVVVGWSVAPLSGLAVLVVLSSAAAVRLLGMARVVHRAVATVTLAAGLVAVRSTRERPPWRERLDRVVGVVVRRRR